MVWNRNVTMYTIPCWMITWIHLGYIPYSIYIYIYNLLFLEPVNLGMWATSYQLFHPLKCIHIS